MSGHIHHQWRIDLRDRIIAEMREEIKVMDRQIDILMSALLEISQLACSMSPEQKIANDAIAKVGAGRTAEVAS